MVFHPSEDAYFYTADHTEVTAKRFPLGFAVAYQPDFHTALLLTPGEEKPRNTNSPQFNRFKQDCKDIRFIRLKQFCTIWLMACAPGPAMSAKLRGKNPIVEVLGINADIHDWWVAYSVSD